MRRATREKERKRPPPGVDSAAGLDVGRRRDGAEQSPGLPSPSPPTPRLSFPPPREGRPYIHLSLADPVPRTFSRATDRSATSVRPYVRIRTSVRKLAATAVMLRCVFAIGGDVCVGWVLSLYLALSVVYARARALVKLAISGRDVVPFGNLRQQRVSSSALTGRNFHLDLSPFGNNRIEMCECKKERSDKPRV